MAAAVAVAGVLKGRGQNQCFRHLGEMLLEKVGDLDMLPARRTFYHRRGGGTGSPIDAGALAVASGDPQLQQSEESSINPPLVHVTTVSVAFSNRSCTLNEAPRPGVEKACMQTVSRY